MKTSQEILLTIIQDKCSSLWQLDVFMDHIIINLPDKELNFRSAFMKVKQDIMLCVQQHFPKRDTEILFEVRNGSWNCSFKLKKTIFYAGAV